MRLTGIALLALIAIGGVLGHGDHGHDHDHSHEGEDPNSHVLTLGNDNFDAEIAKNEITLVEFYAPWCGHCKKLAPEFEKAAHALEGKGSLAKVDCTTEQTVCGKFDVKGYPTVKLFKKDGSHAEYPGGRTADAIIKFMEKQNSPAYTELNSADAIKNFIGKDVTAVGFFSDASGAEYDAFIATAKALRNDYSFGVVTQGAASLAQANGASSVPAVVVFKPFGEDNAAFDGEYTQEKLSEFVNGEAFPLIGEIGPENYQKYLERKLSLVWFFVEPNTDVTTALLATASTVAKDFKGKLSFVHLDGVRWADHAKNFGVKGKPPGVVIEDRTKNKNFVYSQDKTLSVDELKAWAQSYVDGSLQPTVKSQEIPEKNDGPVKTVVGKSFDSIVMDEGKDVFVEFYAPWCGHCKSLAPKFDKLGEMFAGEPTIVIAKVDATENDTPATVRGFPTLMLYQAGNKANPVTYSGDREEKAMFDWIKDHSKTLKGASADHAHDEL
jgi:protein disulfide-isomerase A1